MARPRTPAKILEAKGAFKKNPNRKRTEPETLGLISKIPPMDLTEEQAGAWAEIVEMAPEGVLTISDNIIVEITARMLVDFRKEKTPTAAQVNSLSKLLGCMGMTPADRSRVTVVPQKQQNPFEVLKR